MALVFFHGLYFHSIEAVIEYEKEFLKRKIDDNSLRDLISTIAREIEANALIYCSHMTNLEFRDFIMAEHIKLLRTITEQFRMKKDEKL